jgi:hypothetical protein
MSRDAETFVTDKDPKEALHLCTAWVRDRTNEQVVAQSPSNLVVIAEQAPSGEGRRGFAAPTARPARAVVHVEAIPSGTVISIERSDAAAGPPDEGTAAWFADLVSGLRDALA